VQQSGAPWWSWVTIDDVAAMFDRALEDDAMRGIHNAVDPEPVTNRRFTKTLGHVLGRPTVLPLPAFAGRLALRKMADALLLASTRVVPARLLQSEFAFRDPLLEPARRRLTRR
jgi:NAD dependent epimerase/dehydratase family enzyme